MSSLWTNPSINCESQNRRNLMKRGYEINKDYLNIKNPTVDVTKKHPLLLFEILAPRSFCTSQISVNKWYWVKLGCTLARTKYLIAATICNSSSKEDIPCNLVKEATILTSTKVIETLQTSLKQSGKEKYEDLFSVFCSLNMPGHRVEPRVSVAT